MKRQSQFGLVAEGSSTRSDILRLPHLAEELGPIKARALRVARRLSNLLRAGYAVSDHEELQAARLILIKVPDAAAPRIVQELAQSELVFKDLSFVLCESWLRIDVLEPLKMRGASVATLLSVPSIHRDWFIVDGEVSAVRQVRRFLERNDARACELRPGCKQLYLAAELLMTTLASPLFLAAQQALREGGIYGNHLTAVLEGMAQKTVQDFVKGSRVSRCGPLAECSPATAKEHLDALHAAQPEIAQMVDQQLSWARSRSFK